MNSEINSDSQRQVLPNELTGKDDPTTWVSHPIDIRISMPLLHTRFYCTIVAGRERRPAHRRLTERKSFPILTFGNAFFVLGVTTLFTLMGLTILIARSAIIEY